MLPIQLSRSERASLQLLMERPREVGEIPPDHREKFINYDLVRQNVLLLFITPLGQLELLRQRFRTSPALGRRSLDALSALRHRHLLSGSTSEKA